MLEKWPAAPQSFSLQLAYSMQRHALFSMSMKKNARADSQRTSLKHNIAYFLTTLYGQGKKKKPFRLPKPGSHVYLWKVSGGGISPTQSTELETDEKWFPKGNSGTVTRRENG